MLIPDEVVQPRALLETALMNVSDDEAALDTRLASLHHDERATPLEGLRGIVVRVTEIMVIDNRRGWPFGLGDRPADVYPIFLVASGGSDHPVRFELPGIFNGVRDRTLLNIAPPGLTIRRHLDRVPDYLDVHAVLMRSRAAQRDFAGALSEALDSDEGRRVIETIGALSAVVNPAGSLAVGAATSLLNIYLRHLKAERDKQLYYGVLSLEKQIDALGIGREFVMENETQASISLRVKGIY